MRLTAENETFSADPETKPVTIEDEKALAGVIEVTVRFGLVLKLNSEGNEMLVESE